MNLRTLTTISLMAMTPLAFSSSTDTLVDSIKTYVMDAKFGKSAKPARLNSASKAVTAASTIIAKEALGVFAGTEGLSQKDAVKKIKANISKVDKNAASKVGGRTYDKKNGLGYLRQAFIFDTSKTANNVGVEKVMERLSAIELSPKSGGFGFKENYYVYADAYDLKSSTKRLKGGSSWNKKLQAPLSLDEVRTVNKCISVVLVGDYCNKLTFVRKSAELDGEQVETMMGVLRTGKNTATNYTNFYLGKQLNKNTVVIYNVGIQNGDAPSDSQASRLLKGHITEAQLIRDQITKDIKGLRSL